MSTSQLAVGQAPHTAANLVFFPGVVDPDIAGSAGPITNPELDPYSKKGGDREPEI